MVSKEIENSIVKYFSQSADIRDLDLLNSWISNEENHPIFKEYVKTHFAINLAMNDPNLDNIKKELLKKIRKEKNLFYKYRVSFLKYVAIAVLLLSLVVILKFNDSNKENIEKIVPRADAITLDLGNGKVEIINDDETSKVINVNGEVLGEKKGNELVYDDDNEETTLTYNTLRVPNGKKFNIVLSDGSKVHLNSGSSITYPVKFLKDLSRNVMLTGEAYFDIAHDSENKFIVNTNELRIQVYGTKFNVSNYPEDNDTEVVLVQGSVSLDDTTNSKEFFLKPGYKGSFDKESKNIINEKVNTSLYTSWIDGNLVFRNTPFNNIIKKLERAYNVVIINNNEKLGTETFNATIETNYETIEQVLNYFDKVYQIKYSIVENKVIIN